MSTEVTPEVKDHQVAEVEGLQYIPNFITAEEEQCLLKAIDKAPWSDALRRRTQHFGYRYDYTSRDVPERLGPLPEWAQPIADRLVQMGHPRPDQLIVNEYLPGQGISKHIDQPRAFGPVVASLSLGSRCVMTFEPTRNVADAVSHDVLLERCSLAVLTGPARYQWFHSIPARKADMWKNRNLMRSRRVSLTFRAVIGGDSKKRTRSPESAESVVCQKQKM